MNAAKQLKTGAHRMTSILDENVSRAGVAGLTLEVFGYD
jgi:hypothetical protein